MYTLVIVHWYLGTVRCTRHLYLCYMRTHTCTVFCVHAPTYIFHCVHNVDPIVSDVVCVITRCAREQFKLGSIQTAST